MIKPALLFAALAGNAGTCPPKPAGGQVARAAPFGGVIAPTPEDAEEAVAAGILARDSARRFLALDPPPFLIAPGPIAAKSSTSATGGCALHFPWHFPRGDDGSRMPSHVLPHEIGHTLFIRFLAPKTRAEEYGGGAPDWLDEMAAMAFENDEGVLMRRSEARRHAEAGELIPLKRLLSMPHPEWSARKAAGGPGPAPGSTTAPGSADTPAFYATVRALFDFLIDRTGDEQVIRRLAEAARTGAPLDRWLIARSGRDGASKGLSGLDARLLAFVLDSAAYDPVRAPDSAEGPGR